MTMPEAPGELLGPLGDPIQYTPPTRVRFGKQPHQLLDLPVAEAILCRISEEYAPLFGRMLAEAMIGPEASAGPKRQRPPA